MASRRTALGGAALLLTLAAPAAASAAVVTPTAPCVRYVPTRPPAATLGLSSSGWAPGAALTFKVAGKVVGTGQADPTGAFANAAGLFTPPEPGHNVQSTKLTAEDGAGGYAEAPLRVVRLTVRVPASAKPSRRVRYRAYGFQPGRRLYLFVRRHGRTKGRFSLGKPKGDCGRVTKRMRYMPLHKWRTGRYQYWYSHSRHYSRRTRIYGYTIRISKSVNHHAKGAAAR